MVLDNRFGVEGFAGEPSRLIRLPGTLGYYISLFTSLYFETKKRVKFIRRILRILFTDSNNDNYAFLSFLIRRNNSSWKRITRFHVEIENLRNTDPKV